jgi:hypothetical protein
MATNHSLFIIFIGLFFLVLVVFSIRKNLIRVSYGVFWVLFCLFIATFPLFPAFYKTVGEFTGILNSDSLFLFLSLIGLSLLCIQFTMALGHAFHQRKANIQYSTLLEERIESLEKKLDDLATVKPRLGS